MTEKRKGQLALIVAVVLLLAIGVAAAVITPMGSLYPGQLDDDDNMAGVAPGYVVTSTLMNTVLSAIRNIEASIGVDSHLLDENNSVLDRINGLPDTSSDNTFTGKNNFKILNNTLNAGLFAGSDIGAKVNDAVHGVSGCDSVVGAGGFCRVVIPPTSNIGDWPQTTAIVIDRNNTELDCQGATLLTVNTFNSNPIIINYTTGTGDGVFQHQENPIHTASNITVRNCNIVNTAQVSNTTFYGSPASSSGPAVDRGGRILVWNVEDLLLSNIFVFSSYGPAIQVLHSSGIVENVRVNKTRLPYTGGNATGLWTRGRGTFSAGSTGIPIRVSGIDISTSRFTGIFAEAGSTISDANVTGAYSACLLIAGGWVTLDGFNFIDCVNTSTANVGAIDDFGIAGLSDVANIAIRNGSIKRTGGDGMRLASALSCNGVDVANVDVECFGYEHNEQGDPHPPGAVGIRVGNTTLDYTRTSVSNSSVVSSSTCTSVSLPGATGIAVETTSGPALISNNNVGPLAVTSGATGEGIFVRGAGVTVVGNSVHGVNEEGIVVSDSEHTIVASNNVTDVGLAAVKIHASAGAETQDIAVVANKFSDVCGGT